MKRLVWIAGFLALALVVFNGLLFVASESGEVVVVTTFDAAGGHETRLWVVDFEGDAYLRAGSADALWFRRLKANPRIAVARGGETFSAQAGAEAHRQEEIDAIMGLKYGRADWLVGLFSSREHAVPVRLVEL